MPLRQGLKEMKGTATFHMESFSRDKVRQQYLDNSSQRYVARSSSHPVIR